jgi:hypothetical protein
MPPKCVRSSRLAGIGRQECSEGGATPSRRGNGGRISIRLRDQGANNVPAVGLQRCISAPGFQLPTSFTPIIVSTGWIFSLP